MKNIDVLNCLEKWCPSGTAASYDNVGFLVGDRENEVTKILVALDCTSAVIEEAIKIGANLIVTHHPIIWAPLKNVTEQTRVFKLIKNGISVISCHTNLDLAEGGVNDKLAEKLELENIQILDNSDGDFCSRFGELKEELTACDFAKFIKEKLGTVVRYNKAKNSIKKVAICGGAGSEMLVPALLSGCDALVTADLKHSTFITAEEKGIALFDAGHFHTENMIVKPLADYLKLKTNLPVFESEFVPVEVL